MNNSFMTNWFLSKLNFSYNQDKFRVKTKQITDDKYLSIGIEVFLFQTIEFVYLYFDK